MQLFVAQKNIGHMFKQYYNNIKDTGAVPYYDYNPQYLTGCNIITCQQECMGACSPILIMFKVKKWLLGY